MSPGVIWVAGRLLVYVVAALCVLGLPQLREPMAALLVRVFGIVDLTHFVIWRASTPVTRMALALGAMVVFLVILKAGEKIGGWMGFFGALAAAGVMSRVLAGIPWSEPLLAFVVMCLLASNCAPMSVLRQLGLTEARLDRLILVPPLVGELLFAGRYVAWISAKARGRAPEHKEEAMKLPGAILAALVLAAFCPPDRLIETERLIRSGDDVRVFARGDFFSLAFDTAHERLIATGHGTATLLSYDASNLDAPPIEASVPSYGAQCLDFDPELGEVYVYSWPDEAIQVFDAATLVLRETIPVQNLSPGDAWIEHEPITNTLIVASEADEQIGQPMLMFDRTTHDVVDSRSEDGGYIVARPDAPIIYMSFFRRVREILAYDLQQKAIIARVETDGPMDELSFDTRRGELLVTAPASGLIHRFDQDTLEPKGSYRGVVGVRAIAVDEVNDLILIDSLATGTLVMIGLDDHEVERSWYLGPWLRSIVVVPHRGVAYVSSQSALYEVRYLADE